MKPTLPEEHEPDDAGAEVSARYREIARDEPSSQLDARILDAARREVAQPQRRNWMRNPLPREWHVPASVAAVLVLAVSLGLIIRDNEPPLLSADSSGAGHSPAGEAKLAKAAPPQLTMKAQPKSGAESDRESRPSRDRSERPDRQLLARAAPSPSQANVAAAPALQDAPATPPAQVPAPAPQAGAGASAGMQEKEQAPVAEFAGDRAKSKKAEAADASTGRIATLQGLRKQDSAIPVPAPQDWIRKIEALLDSGKQAEARDQLTALRREYPAHPLPERLQALLPPQN